MQRGIDVEQTHFGEREQPPKNCMVHYGNEAILRDRLAEVMKRILGEASVLTKLVHGQPAQYTTGPKSQAEFEMHNNDSFCKPLERQGEKVMRPRKVGVQPQHKKKKRSCESHSWLASKTSCESLELLEYRDGHEAAKLKNVLQVLESDTQGRCLLLTTMTQVHDMAIQVQEVTERYVDLHNLVKHEGRNREKSIVSVQATADACKADITALADARMAEIVKVVSVTDDRLAQQISKLTIELEAAADFRATIDERLDKRAHQLHNAVQREVSLLIDQKLDTGDVEHSVDQEVGRQVLEMEGRQQELFHQMEEQTVKTSKLYDEVQAQEQRAKQQFDNLQHLVDSEIIKINKIYDEVQAQEQMAKQRFNNLWQHLDSEFVKCATVSELIEKRCEDNASAIELSLPAHKELVGSVEQCFKHMRELENRMIEFSHHSKCMSEALAANNKDRTVGEIVSQAEDEVKQAIMALKSVDDEAHQTSVDLLVKFECARDERDHEITALQELSIEMKQGAAEGQGRVKRQERSGKVCLVSQKEKQASSHET